MFLLFVENGGIFDCCYILSLFSFHCVTFYQIVAVVCQFPDVQAAINTTVTILQTGIPIAKIGTFSLFSSKFDILAIYMCMLIFIRRFIKNVFVKYLTYLKIAYTIYTCV
jgi:hypothetical protein